MNNCLVTKLNGSIVTDKHLELFDAMQVSFMRNGSNPSNYAKFQIVGDAADVDKFYITGIFGSTIYSDTGLTNPIERAVPVLTSGAAIATCYVPSNPTNDASINPYSLKIVGMQHVKRFFINAESNSKYRGQGWLSDFGQFPYVRYINYRVFTTFDSGKFEDLFKTWALVWDKDNATIDYIPQIWKTGTNCNWSFNGAKETGTLGLQYDNNTKVLSVYFSSGSSIDDVTNATLVGTYNVTTDTWTYV